MSNFSLDDIRAAADAKYGSTDIDVSGTTCRLVNPLRLPKEKRDALMAVQERISADATDEAPVDQEALLGQAIRIVCQNDNQANILLGAVGDDLALLVEIFERYTGEQEVGEASASAA